MRKGRGRSRCCFVRISEISWRNGGEESDSRPDMERSRYGRGVQYSWEGRLEDMREVLDMHAMIYCSQDG